MKREGKKEEWRPKCRNQRKEKIWWEKRLFFYNSYGGKNNLLTLFFYIIYCFDSNCQDHIITTLFFSYKKSIMDFQSLLDNVLFLIKVLNLPISTSSPFIPPLWVKLNLPTFVPLVALLQLSGIKIKLTFPPSCFPQLLLHQSQKKSLWIQ